MGQKKRHKQGNTVHKLLQNIPKATTKINKFPEECLGTAQVVRTKKNIA